MSEQRKASLILASASPRRKDLLKQAGFKFKVVPSSVDESSLKIASADPAGFAAEVALAKAMEVAGRYPAALVIGADTVVDFNGGIIGKPADAEDAERIIRLLFSAPHKVITAVAIIRIKDHTQVVETDTTTVYPKKLTDEQIANYIKTSRWQGKAGAYGIRETSDEFVEKIDGSITNVMGLPMELVQRLLTNLNDSTSAQNSTENTKDRLN